MAVQGFSVAGKPRIAEKKNYSVGLKKCQQSFSDSIISFIFVAGNGSPNAPFNAGVRAIKREPGASPGQSRCCEPHSTRRSDSGCRTILTLCHCSWVARSQE